MKKLKKIQREHIWFGLMILGVITAFSSIYDPPFFILALVFLFISVKGIMWDIL